jgi:hypothetical protein
MFIYILTIVTNLIRREASMSLGPSHCLCSLDLAQDTDLRTNTLASNRIGCHSPYCEWSKPVKVKVKLPVRMPWSRGIAPYIKLGSRCR